MGLSMFVTMRIPPNMVIISCVQRGLVALGSDLPGVMYVYVGVGVTAGVYLGWIDTEGFRMMGLQGA